jgi:glycosyltransferase involved in cell wall biosynthesis
MISIAITVCNEHKELETLLDYLSEQALSPDYEIVIQIDEQNYTPEVLHAIINRGIKHHFFPLNNNFASYKNELIKHCSGEYIFQIDADELIASGMFESLPLILRANPEVDLYYVPRINTVSGITQEHIQKWGWRYENERVNWPDYQTRIYKNSPNIRWKNAVHEVIEGHKQFTFLPAVDELALIHHKSIEKQEKQNKFYESL